MFRRIALLALVLLLLTGCGTITGQTQEMQETVSVTDDLGREAQVPLHPDRVAALTGSFADIWCLAGGTETIAAATHDTWTNFDLALS